MRVARLLTDNNFYRWFLFFLVLAGGTTFLAVFLLVWTGPLRFLFPDPLYFPGRDFKLHYDIAVAFLNGQDPALLNFQFFPLTIFYLLPFSYLVFSQAFMVITVWNLLLALTLALVADRVLKHYHVNLPSGTVWLFFLAYVFFCPVTAEITSANVNTLVACSTALFYYFLFVKRRNVWAALCLAVATLFKIFPAFLVLMAFLDRRYKFVLAFITVMALSVAASILLLGFPAHLNWLDFLSSVHQGGAALTFGHNATITAILYKTMQFLGINGTETNPAVNVAWLAFRSALVVLLLCYLVPIFRKNLDDMERNRWTIVSFSLLSVLMISLPNAAWSYYASCLVLPFILCLYCLELNMLDRILIALSVAFFSFNTHIDNLASFTGGALGTLFHLLHPAAIGNLLFMAFTLVYMARLKRGRSKTDAAFN